MRTIEAGRITAAVAKLAVEANYYLTEDIFGALAGGQKTEESPLGREILGQLVENACIARDQAMPICQDTGMAVVFMEIGQDVRVVDGGLEEAVNAGVAKGYTEGYLRKSVVDDPVFIRKNTGDNTPAILHVAIVPGDKIKIVLAPKGFGSENMSALKMFPPSAGVSGIKKFAVDTVSAAGSNPCPPIVIGMGIGGTMEKAAFLAKKALIRPISVRNANPEYATLEAEILELVNKTGVGPQGLGGTVTALAVNIEYYPTHIAGMPVAININCHATRHAEIEI
ncbi:fumarate hydratase [Anaeroselena agilis]|uniref:Fumarate hydratase n=1 Tax=Anaeroselena agilis TaxID=3063788 RepID=A0ABU3NT08_9FIRM|nr:fumarate hydratase [Selenomonadales bacterium 4137-cl]